VVHKLAQSQKRMYIQDVLCIVTENYVIKVLILGSWERRFLRSCIHNTCTVPIIKHYIRI